MTVRTRFAPSPTGYLHIGGVRTALFSWLYARRHGGEFVLRIEDTDRARSTDDALKAIIEGMNWLGLDHDEGPYYQTQRFERYQAVIQQFMDEDNAYHCYCSREELDEMRATAMARGEKPKYSGKCRHRKGDIPVYVTPVVRFKNPLEGEVIIDDLIQGQVIFQNRELDDLIIARSDGTPTYNLTVVVDDMDMAISHVMRGDDHLNNTPRQINMFKALGASLPEFAHVPMILGPDGKKLSKRQGTVSVLEYRDEGYLPEALLNYLVRLGWSHGDQEIFSIDEMIQLFDIAEVNKAASAINPDKLLWLNQHYIKEAETTGLSKLARDYFEAANISLDDGPELETLIAVQQERVKTMTELAEQSRYFYEDFSEFDEKAAKKNLRPVVLEPLGRLLALFTETSEWEKENLHNLIEKAASEFDMKLGKIAQPLRVAVTGGAVSPSIDITLQLIGRKRCLERMGKALIFIKQRAET